MTQELFISDEIIQKIQKFDSIIFDCDGVLVDIRQSYDNAINKTISAIMKELFDAKGADTRVYNALIEQGISIRKLGKLASHKGCLRVTIGTPDMNSKFLLAIRDLLE